MLPKWDKVCKSVRQCNSVPKSVKSAKRHKKMTKIGNNYLKVIVQIGPFVFYWDLYIFDLKC